MPKGPSDRPIPSSDPEAVAIEAALRRAQERGTAPAAPGHAPAPDSPETSSTVEQTEAVGGATVQAESRGAHSFILRKKEEKKQEDLASGEDSPDPRGKGTTLDTRV